MFWGNNFFVGKFFNFRIFQTPLLKSFGLYSKKFLAELSKLQSTCLEEQFAEIFFRNISSFWITFDIWQIFCGYFAGTFRQFCPNCILPVKRKLLEDFFLKLFLSKCIPILSKKFSDVWQKKLRRGFRNCILPVRKKILEKKFFRKVLLSFFEYFYSLSKTVSGILVKNSRQACRNSIPCVKRNVSRKIFSGKKIRISKHFQKLDGRIFDFNQKFPAVSSKLQPTCPEEYFD